VNTSAIWALDIIIALGMVLAGIGMVVLARRMAAFAKSLSATIQDIGKQTMDLESEVTRLMQSTQASEHHFDQLTRQLTKLAASTDTVVKALPSIASSRHGSALPEVLSTAARAVSVYKVVRSIISRRRS